MEEQVVREERPAQREVGEWIPAHGPERTDARGRHHASSDRDAEPLLGPGLAQQALCPTTTGTLSGTVTLFALTGDPNSLSAPKALVDLRKIPGDPPLLAMADDTGHYEVDLDEGAWIVGGESADGFCTTMMPKTVTVEACKLTTADVVLESCIN